MRTAWAVSLEPAPAITMARPARASLTWRISSCFSGVWVVGDSPVVPDRRIMSAPSSTRLTARARAASKSTSPLGVKGVTMATPTEPKLREGTALMVPP